MSRRGSRSPGRSSSSSPRCRTSTRTPRWPRSASAAMRRGRQPTSHLETKMTSPSSLREDDVPAPVPPPLNALDIPYVISHRYGRIIRFRERLVTVLTNDPECAHWLIKQGGATFLPRHLEPGQTGPFGSYRRSPGGPLEWDIYIHHIPVDGEETIWAAAAGEITLDPEQLG